MYQRFDPNLTRIKKKSKLVKPNVILLVKSMLKMLPMILFSTLFGWSSFASALEGKQEFVTEKKLVVITGATKGIGLGLVREFISRGWRVAGCGRSAKTIEDLQNKYGPENLFSIVDITDDAAVAQWVRELTSKIDTPSILINNAGLINHPKVLWEISSAEFSDIMDTNVLGTVNVLRHFIPLMIQKEKGLIVNMSSGWGVNGKEKFSPYCTEYGEGKFSPYCASKFAIEGLTQSLSQELPQGLTVVTLAPGAISTDMLQKAYPEKANQYPKAEQRAKVIVSYIMNIKPSDSGKHLSIEK